MMKGIKFNNVHSYDDLNLVLSSVDIPPATVKTNFVDIPGGDGSVDLTEAFGKITYKNRECKFVFTVFPYEDFEEKKREISNLLNGKQCRITLDKDPEYYWIGRCAISDYASNKNLHKITVKATVSPYKLKLNQTRVIIQPGENIVKSLLNGRRAVVPIITNTHDATIMFMGQTFNLEPGTHKVLNIELLEGVNRVTVTSAGTVEFTYQEGDL